ncbi:MAG: YkgJ family cysteine cluster protein [Candidatus Brocadiia bacterium]
MSFCLCGVAPVFSRRRDVWYADGLRFECVRCGKCCGGAPGYVWVDDDDIQQMAEHLGMGEREFLERYCRRVRWRISLRERPNGDCVLLGQDGCTVYPVRPPQCRTFPFWSHLLRSRRRWERAVAECPGIGRGRLYPAEEIQRIAAGKRTT